MLAETADIIGNWVVHPDRMRANIDATRGLIFSQSVLLALTRGGLSREQAYQIVQKNSLKAWTEGLDFKALLRSDPEAGRVLGTAEIEACFSLDPYLGRIDHIFERMFAHES
jgi:adenylosuccinate lyase